MRFGAAPDAPPPPAPLLFAAPAPAPAAFGLFLAAAAVVEAVAAGRAAGRAGTGRLAAGTAAVDVVLVAADAGRPNRWLGAVTVLLPKRETLLGILGSVGCAAARFMCWRISLMSQAERLRRSLALLLILAGSGEAARAT